MLDWRFLGQVAREGRGLGAEKVSEVVNAGMTRLSGSRVRLRSFPLDSNRFDRLSDVVSARPGGVTLAQWPNFDAPWDLPEEFNRTLALGEVGAPAGLCAPERPRTTAGTRPEKGAAALTTPPFACEDSKRAWFDLYFNRRDRRGRLAYRSDSLSMVPSPLVRKCRDDRADPASRTPKAVWPI